MAIALAYFAEHYFIDAFVGWAIVGASFFAWNRIERSLDARRATETEPSADELEIDRGSAPIATVTESSDTDGVPIDAVGDGDGDLAIDDDDLAQSNPR
jgi:hypothetical protein